MGAKADKGKGQAKQAAGVVTRDRDLEARGKAERKAGQAEERIDGAKDRVKDFLDDAVDRAADVAGMVRNKLPGK